MPPFQFTALVWHPRLHDNALVLPKLLVRIDWIARKVNVAQIGKVARVRQRLRSCDADKIVSK